MSYLKRSLPTLATLNDIDYALDNYEITVRVVKLWTVYKEGRVHTIEMVLTDRVGTRIHATVEEDMIKKFEAKFVEGHAITIITFPFTSYIGDHRTTTLPFKMLFYRTTVVEPYNNFPEHVPPNYLADFRDIKCDKLNRAILIDVMGQMVSTGYIESYTFRERSMSYTKFRFVLRDICDTRLTCILWGNYAKTVIEYVNNNMGKSIMVVIRFACITELKGEIIVTNTCNSTQLFLDPKFPEVEEFKSNLRCCRLVPNQSMQSVLELQYLNYREEFFAKHRRRSLSSIVGLVEAGQIVTLAVVNSIETFPRWYYIACRVCNQEVQPYTEVLGSDGPSLYDCSNCNTVLSDVTARYRLILRVSDNKGCEANFVVFDHVAEHFLCQTAHELADEVAHEDPSILPGALKRLITKELLFKVNISAENVYNHLSALRVDLICEDDDIIQDFVSSSRTPLENFEDSRVNDFYGADSDMYADMEEIISSRLFMHSDVSEDLVTRSDKFMIDVKTPPPKSVKKRNVGHDNSSNL